MDTIKKLYKEFIKTYSKKWFYFTIFTSGILAFLTILEPLFFSEIIKQIEIYLKDGTFDKDLFFKIIIFWILFNIIFLITSYIVKFYVIEKSALENHRRVFNDKIWDILKMEYGTYLSKKSGSIYKNFDRWTWAQWEAVFFFLNDYAITILQIIWVTVFLSFVDFRMTLISLSLVPVMFIFGFFMNRKTLKKQKQINEIYDKIFWNIWDYFNNFLLSKTLWLEKKFEKEEIELINETTKKQAEISKWRVIMGIYKNIIINLSRVIVIWFWAYFVINWELEFYKLFLFYAYLSYIYGPLDKLFSSFRNIQKIISEAKKFYEEFDNLEKENLEKWENLEKISGKIEFKNVDFSYNSEKKILKNLSFTINSWETMAFVWNTWAWKSTIINLILRLFEAKSWEILFDEKNLKNISKESLRKHIWIVTQDVSLFNDTLRQNLLYAKENATEEEIWNALENANAWFVKKLNLWLDTVIWERGLKLSWWEKQRIAIARLFLKNPEILILDEATSALDNKTEKQVQKALDNLMKWKTSIIIAHRLSTIQNAEKIFFLEEWIIKETGTYDELIAKNGKFSELANPKNLVIN